MGPMFVALGVWMCLSAVEAHQLDFYESKASRLEKDQTLAYGDICKQANGSLWTCKKMVDCPKAQQDLRKGHHPQNCRFIGTQPVVCCEPEVKPPPYSGKNKEMCEEYAKSVFIDVPSELDDTVFKMDTCINNEPCIVGGHNAEPREFPHMALIGYEHQSSIYWLCGGSLISERFILSAAHCTETAQGQAGWARLGDYNFQSRNDDLVGHAQTQDYEIIERINHPDYKNPLWYNDIALYKLASEVRFNGYIRPICLNTEHQFPKTYALATGWGHTEKGIPSAILQKVNLTLTPRKDCSHGYNSILLKDNLSNGIRDNSMFCAGDTINGKDTCQGDSGGPLQLPLSDPYCMYSQIGITSFGSLCGGNIPGVYTRVSHFVPWIESIVWS